MKTEKPESKAHPFQSQFYNISAAVLRSDLSSELKILYAYLCHVTRATGVVGVSNGATKWTNETIGRHLGIKSGTARDQISKLIQLGLVNTEPASGRGRWIIPNRTLCDSALPDDATPVAPKDEYSATPVAPIVQPEQTNSATPVAPIVPPEQTNSATPVATIISSYTSDYTSDYTNGYNDDPNGVDWDKDNRSKQPLRERDHTRIITLFNFWGCGNKEASKEEWSYVPEKQRDIYYTWLEEEMKLKRNGNHKLVDERIPFEEVLRQRIVGSAEYNRYIKEMQLA